VFWETAQQSKVILLHPSSRLRSPLVARLLDEPAYHTLYYAMGPDDLSVESVVTGLIHGMANQMPLFGRHLSMLRRDEFSNPDTVIPALQRELLDIRDKQIVLIIDEYDRCDSADDVQIFFEALAAHLPDHCWLVINSRTMPRLPVVSMIAQKHALLLQDETVIQHDFYGAAQQLDHELEVYGLGPGLVLINGKLVEDWEGHLPRLLLFFALDKAVVTRSEICRAFWPDLDMEQAVNVFHVTKRRLHKALEVDFDILLHNEGYYYLNPILSVDYDVMSFVTALLHARADNRYENWQRVVDFYRGPFLQGNSEAWIMNRRRDYRAGFVEALSHMAALRTEAGREEHALSLLLRAAGEDSENEGVHRSIIKLYGQLGRRSEAAAHYFRLVEALRKQGQSVTEETEMTYQQVVG
jgi:DNA-binding SARP family transcriptional activator